MTSALTREQALELLKKYNKDPFHIRHALTVEGVMRWYASAGNSISFWRRLFQQCSPANSQ